MTGQVGIPGATGAGVQIPQSPLAEILAKIEELERIRTWKPLILESGWVNIGEAPLNEPASYIRDGLGFVHLRGRIKGGASGSIGFTLPVGFRPGATNGIYVCAGWNGAAPTAAFIDFEAAGKVGIYLSAGTIEIGLGGVTFLAEA